MATRDAGPGWTPDLVEELRAVPVLAVASEATRRKLSRHVDRLDVADATIVIEANQPVRWVVVPLEGRVRSDGPHGRTWGAGQMAGLPEGLTHDVAASSVRTDGPGRVLFVDIRALTAAASTDAAVGLAIARSLVNAAADTTGAARARGRRRRAFERRPRASRTRTLGPVT